MEEDRIKQLYGETITARSKYAYYILGLQMASLGYMMSQAKDLDYTLISGIEFDLLLCSISLILLAVLLTLGYIRLSTELTYQNFLALKVKQDDVQANQDKYFKGKDYLEKLNDRLICIYKSKFALMTLGYISYVVYYFIMLFPI